MCAHSYVLNYIRKYIYKCYWNCCVAPRHKNYSNIQKLFPLTSLPAVLLRLCYIWQICNELKPYLLPHYIQNSKYSKNT